MDPLLEGYSRFRAEIWPEERARYQALARFGQKPETLVISCSDSRVDPQTVFGAVPGELFVVRNVAGLIPPFSPDSRHHGTSAALEFGVRILKVARIVVLGHAQCGGIRAMVEGVPGEASDFVEPWMAIAASVMENLPPDLPHHDLLDHCETEVVRLTLVNLQTFPWIRDAVAAGHLTVQGFRFDIHSGVLARLEEGGFVPVAAEGAKP